KWQNEATGAGDLHAFHGKLEEKANWTRGLFVSYSGFSTDGLKAFGRRKRLICLDGADLAEALNRELPLTSCLSGKSGTRPRPASRLRKFESSSRSRPTSIDEGAAP